MFGSDSEQTTRDRAVFFLLAALVTVFTSIFVFYYGAYQENWPKMDTGMIGMFVGMYFFALFAKYEGKLQKPLTDKKLFLNWVDFWSIPVSIASFLIMIALLGYASYTGQLWQDNLINSYTVTVMGLFGLFTASFIAKALIWNHPEMKE